MVDGEVRVWTEPICTPPQNPIGVTFYGRVSRRRKPQDTDGGHFQPFFGNEVLEK
ncbi:hypothetical protein M569_14544 [Genlisea aurea]|uniref:Uncharacterized protein n=1 Tax=Genlisea aurea TaxID=192259 RepID=S8C771_9LAMI|nr:hypothetical protein M569_14544 [Genlisea aurea]